MMDKYYALTEKGYNRVDSNGLGKSLADQLLDTMFDLEEEEPDQPHSKLVLLADTSTNLGWSYEKLEKALAQAAGRGLIEEVFDWDERFPGWT